MTRRELLKSLGGGILVLAFAPDDWATLFVQRSGQQVPDQISAWVHIAPDGAITVMTGKVEVGQNARTSITQAAAEELRVAPDSIKVVMGDTDLVPFDMGTFGSRTTPTMLPQVRRAAASARQILLDLGGKKWQVDPGQLTASKGVVSGGGHSATYGELAQGLPLDGLISRDIPLTPTAEWKTMGTSLPKVDGRDFVTGKHEYASDLKRPGMLFAKVLRGPGPSAKLVSADTSKAAAMKGVQVVRDGDFVAVAAPTLRFAQKALKAIEAKWEPASLSSSVEIHKVLRAAGGEPAPKPSGAKTRSAIFTCPYIAHVPLEPRAALAEWDGKKMTVHTGTQRPFGVRDEVAAALGLPVSQVRVIVPDTGSGYGGKHQGDAAVEAARIAKATGKPIRLVWTREEEFTFAYFRPAGVIEAAAAYGADGKLTGWAFDNYNSGGSGLQTPYAVAAKQEKFHQVDSPLRQGSYRGLAATFNNFARETLMDEIAHSLGLDPVEFRLRNLTDERLIAVLKAAALKFGWLQRRPEPRHGFGIACGTEKGSYVATAVEVSDINGEIKVLHAVTAYECGAIVNPSLLQNQVEGAVIQGLGGALMEAIRFADGQIITNKLSSYPVPRYSDVPRLETVLLDRKDLPSAGAGETPIICIAPAIGNAIFAATGIRARSLPLQEAMTKV